MSTITLVMIGWWALVGACGALVLRAASDAPQLLPRPVMAAIGGAIGGALYTTMWPSATDAATGAAASAVGALVGAVVTLTLADRAIQLIVHAKDPLSALEDDDWSVVFERMTTELQEYLSGHMTPELCTQLVSQLSVSKLERGDGRPQTTLTDAVKGPLAELRSHLTSRLHHVLAEAYNIPRDDAAEMEPTSFALWISKNKECKDCHAHTSNGKVVCSAQCCCKA